MAVNILNTSTLSEAVSKDANEFTVGATTNITVGDYLVIQGTAGLEAVKVQEIPVSGRVKCLRGQGGTRAFAHKSGTRFFIGDPDDFQSRKAGIVAGIDGNAGDFDDYLIPGARYRDGAGNEYVLVELTAAVTPGATVLISKDGNFTAGILTDAGVGPVGVTVEDGTSDQYTWAQVYGYNGHVKLVGGSSLVTSLGEFGGATSVSTPAVGLLGRSSSQRSSDWLSSAMIIGMFPTSAASTASTSATSETGFFCSAFLNYPFAQRAITS